MVVTSKWRGHEIERRGDGWVFGATGLPTKDDPLCVCGHCGASPTADDHDACLGELPCVMNACCGHGVMEDAYVQYEDVTLRGQEALDEVARIKAAQVCRECERETG